MNTFLWVVFPYISIAVFVVGLIWRYRYDKFGWTTRSSQIYESRLLRIGSPLFHFGIIFAFLGHVMGLIIPGWLTEDLGIPNAAYHVVAVVGGVIAGLMVTVGFVILVFRRRTVRAVFTATTVNDKVMYLVLGLVIFFGMYNTISSALSEEYNYRLGVSPWFRSIFMFQPKPELIAAAPFQFRIHAFLAFLLFLIWPFTRLVHVFSAPFGYLTRPYIVYRSAGQRRRANVHAPAKTWERPTLQDQGRR